MMPPHDCPDCPRARMVRRPSTYQIECSRCGVRVIVRADASGKATMVCPQCGHIAAIEGLPK